MRYPPTVARLAAKQGGYVTRTQLVEAGLSRSAIDRRITAKELETVVASVYRVYDSREHADLIRGAVLALPHAVASHESAAHLLGFPRLPSLKPTVTVPNHTTHLFPGVTVRRCTDLERGQLTTVDAIKTTTVARTAYDLAGIGSAREARYPSRPRLPHHPIRGRP
jgi:hypothetical protein